MNREEYNAELDQIRVVPDEIVEIAAYSGPFCISKPIQLIFVNYDLATKLAHYFGWRETKHIWYILPNHEQALLPNDERAQMELQDDLSLVKVFIDGKTYLTNGKPSDTLKNLVFTKITREPAERVYKNPGEKLKTIILKSCELKEAEEAKKAARKRNKVAS